ncbi:hypothetical protein A2160_02190 [Candidatus Beckwithbacteria bacterium RBG_13_42_9]|uniref:BioF2-like acetyltransferase domain-containing protein n=1 Tax=Candidatus Beckwithbacteria bacterium RBG_13_42_9 TaxID=1797457 RepID=A0A1F5E7R2_9BACT|nr:MAG: hypothetical protein A2160_02190 [Candidatus Beckwithbacteria bacterium RBG_13_42_9]
MIIVRIVDDQTTWETFLSQNPQQNFLQSWCWLEMQKHSGKNVFPLGFYLDNQLQGIALLIKEEARRGPYLACPGGPVLNWDYPKYLKIFTSISRKVAEAVGAWFIRIRPTVKENNVILNTLTKNGFNKAPMHMDAETTWQLDLNPDENELLNQMAKDHRYEIRKAARLGIKVIASSCLKDVKILYQLQLETARRQNFVPFSIDHLMEEFLAFKKRNKAIIFKAVYQGQSIAMGLTIFYGKEAIYHYAAANSLSRKMSGAYAICWEAIREAKRRNLSRFNFWGIAPATNQHHRFTGLNHFKMGFGGERVELVHAHDLVIDPRYWLTYSFESLRRLYRRL